MSEVQTDATASGVEELTSDLFGDSQPAETSEPSQETPSEPTSTAQTQTGQPESAQTAPTQVPGQVFKYQGKDWTWEELGKNPDVARAVITRAEQTAHYQQQLEQARQQAAYLAGQAHAQQQSPQQPQQAQRGVNAAQIQAFYKPAVEHAVKTGMIEQDLAEAFPSFVSQSLYAMDQLVDARGAISHLIQRLNVMEQGSQQNAVEGSIRAQIAGLANNGEHFASLSSPEEQEGFLNYLIQINPQVGQLQQPDFLARQWFAYKSDAFGAQLQQQRQAAAAAESARQNARKLARGDVAGTRPGVAAPQEPNQFEELYADIFPKLVSQR